MRLGRIITHYILSLSLSLSLLPYPTTLLLDVWVQTGDMCPAERKKKQTYTDIQQTRRVIQQQGGSLADRKKWGSGEKVHRFLPWPQYTIYIVWMRVISSLCVAMRFMLFNRARDGTRKVRVVSSQETSSLTTAATETWQGKDNLAIRRRS